MLAFFRDSRALDESLAPAIAQSLGLYHGAPASRSAEAGAIFAQCPLTPARPGARPVPLNLSISAGGWRVLLDGWLDNRVERAAELGLPGNAAADVYAAALDRWGDDADLNMVGEYAAIAYHAETGRLRLARSPFRAPPLHYFRSAGRIAASSVPRILHLCGMSREIDPQQLAENMYLTGDPWRSWFSEGSRVPLGCRVWLTDDDEQRRRYYDPRDVAPVRLKRIEDYVEAADALYREAIRHAIDGAALPGVLLSGGLDSSNLAARMLDAIPADRPLPSFTFVPDKDWVRRDLPFNYGDERPLVEAFAAMHPRLEPHFDGNDGENFDSNWDRMIPAMGAAPAGLSNFHAYQALFAAARQRGCDLLLDADLGNRTFSNNAPWAYGEWLRKGQLRQFYLALRDDPSRQDRSVLRHMIGFALGGLLPDSWWERYWRWSGHDPQPYNRQAALLTDSFLASSDIDERARQRGDRYLNPHYRTRRIYVESALMRGASDGAEIHRGFEQIHGVRWRDATAYRPFVEFCLGAPTELFLRDGKARWLALELGKGLMPEAQRLNRKIGAHSVDWHERMGRRLPELREEIARARNIPELQGVIDFDKAEQILDEWPEESSYDDANLLKFCLAIPRALATTRFVKFATGRNDA